MNKVKVIGVLGASAIILTGAIIMTQKNTVEVPPQTEETVELPGAEDSPNVREIAEVEIVYPRVLNPDNDPCKDIGENTIIKFEKLENKEGIRLCNMSKSLIGKFEGAAFCACREEFCDDTDDFIECVEKAALPDISRAADSPKAREIGGVGTEDLSGAADSPNSREIAEVEIVYPRVLNPDNDPCKDIGENTIIH